jgi:phage terminase small subunit
MARKKQGKSKKLPAKQRELGDATVPKPRRALTNKQQRFVDEYCTNGWNGGRAVMDAGYAAKTMDVAYSIAYENLRKPQIVAAIAERKAELARKCEITLQGQQEKYERTGRAAEAAGQYSAAVRAYDSQTRIIGGFEQDNAQRRAQGQTLIEILAIVDGGTKGVLPCEEVESQPKAGAKRVQSQVLPVAQAGPESPQNGRQATDGPGGG